MIDVPETVCASEIARGNAWQRAGGPRTCRVRKNGVWVPQRIDPPPMMGTTATDTVGTPSGKMVHADGGATNRKREAGP